MVWGPMAAAMTGSGIIRNFMTTRNGITTSAESWNGNLLMLPYFEALQRFDSSTYIGTNGKFTTGAMGLVYAMPHKR